jgi:serine/threonine protein kinase
VYRENIFITADRRVKILDFGLAKLWEGAAAFAGSGAAGSQLVTRAVTFRAA